MIQTDKVESGLSIYKSDMRAGNSIIIIICLYLNHERHIINRNTYPYSVIRGMI